MKSALIGYTGFVGSNLRKQKSFDSLYNSKNFMEMTGQSYSLILCAGVSAVKWKSNKNPIEDKRNIEALQNVLLSVKTEQFVLISTIDVYPITQKKDENFDCHSQENHAYGSHRLAFEDFCLENFPNCYIIRLPALWGDNLKKNIIYDLLNDNCLEMINPSSTFQYYDLKNLWKDIQKAIESDFRIINFFTEPVSSRTILQRFFPEKEVGQKAVPEVHYELHTCHANLWGKSGLYVYYQDEVLSQLDEFIKKYNNKNMT